MGASQELEPDAASAHGADDRGDFKGRLPFAKRQLQIEDIVRMDLGLALNDTAAHRQIKHRSLTADFAPGKREIKPHGNPEMLSPVDQVSGMVRPETERQKAVAARGTAKRRRKKESGKMLP